MNGDDIAAMTKSGGDIGVVPNPPIFAFEVRLAGGGADFSFRVVAEGGKFIFGGDNQVIGVGEIFNS